MDITTTFGTDPRHQVPIVVDLYYTKYEQNQHNFVYDIATDT